MADNMTTQSIKNPVIKEGTIDITKRVAVTLTEKHPFHKQGRKDREVFVAPLVAEKYRLNGWAK